MAYILGTDIGETVTREDVERQRRRWREYFDYIESVSERLPKSAYQFATASWHYLHDDPRCLHDSWVDSLAVRERASGDRHQIRSLEIELHLMGWNHGGDTTLIYRDVHSYSLDTPFMEFVSTQVVGHGDWLCDEVPLSPRDHVLHEIEFSRGTRWTIECRDIEWSWRRITVTA